MTGDLVVFHAEAEVELEAAFDWYAARSRKVADQFLVELNRAIAVILESPRGSERVIGPWHRYSLRRFPFLLYFRETASGIEVVAVAHGRRRPDYWHDRS